MPSDANGVYSLPSGYLAVTGETIQASQHNPPLEDLASSMTQRLMRSGAAPMTGPLKLSDGSASAPGLSFNTATSTGLYKTSAGFAAAVNGAKVAEFSEDGILVGARWIGELIDWTGSTAPALTVFPYGQTLNRSDYPDLWSFAQTEIAAGNAFYNNGNGSTTFGIGDMRGRTRFAPDDMGGTAASRLTETYFGASTTTLGTAGGSQSTTLVTANLPPYTPSGSITNGAINVTINNGTNVIRATGGTYFGTGPTGGETASTLSADASQAPSTFTGSAQGGTSTPFSNIPSALIANCVLFAGA